MLVTRKRKAEGLTATALNFSYFVAVTAQIEAISSKYS